MENVHSLQYFDQMVGVQADTTRLAAAAVEAYPNLARSISACNIPLSHMLISWVICLFTNLTLPSKMKLFMLEYFIVSKKSGIYRTAMYLLSKIDEECRTVLPFEVLAKKFKQVQKHFIGNNFLEKVKSFPIPQSLSDQGLQTAHEYLVLSSGKIDLVGSVIQDYFKIDRKKELSRESSKPVLRIVNNPTEEPRNQEPSETVPATMSAPSDKNSEKIESSNSNMSAEMLNPKQIEPSPKKPDRIKKTEKNEDFQGQLDDHLSLDLSKEQPFQRQNGTVEEVVGH